MIIGIDASRANQREKTGTEWYSWHLIQHLIPRLAGQTIRLYTRESLLGDLSHLKIHAEEHVLRWPPGVMWTHLRLSWEMLWHRPDILLILADTVPIIHPSKTYTTIHDIAFERFPELYGQQSVQRKLGWAKPLVSAAVRLVTLGRYGASELDYHRWSVRHALRACRRIFSVSQFTKQEIIEVLHPVPDKIIVSYQGIPQPEEIASEMASASDEEIKRLNLPAQYFMFNGRLERKKNIVNLLDGFADYRQGGGKVGLVLVGAPGVGWEQIQRWLADHPGISSAIKVLPWQTPPNLWRIMHGATAYVFVGTYEGFGRPPLEAFSCGLPVIAARSSSLPEVLGDCPYYVDPLRPESIAIAMTAVTNDLPAAKATVACGQKQVGRFTWDSTAKIMAQVVLSDV